MALGFVLVALKENFHLSIKSRRANGTGSNETDLDFLLTTGHAACLAASIFWSSSLSCVSGSGKGCCEIKRIAGGRRLRGRVIRWEVMARRRAGGRGGSARLAG